MILILQWGQLTQRRHTAGAIPEWQSTDLQKEAKEEFAPLEWPQTGQQTVLPPQQVLLTALLLHRVLMGVVYGLRPSQAYGSST